MFIPFPAKASFTELVNFFKFLKSLLNSHTQFLISGIDAITEYDNEPENSWLKSVTNDKVPYLIIYDYRKNNLKTWGSFKFIGRFDYPTTLIAYRTQMIELFKKEDKLSKGNKDCPRVQDVFVIDNNLQLHIQQSCYYDQVGSNLTLDFKNSDEFINRIGASNVRHWDIKQSKVNEGCLPTFASSRLANTIGVAVGIIAKNKDGNEVILIRKKTKKHNAIYGDQLHLPLTFALSLDFNYLTEHTEGTLYDLISKDLSIEQYEELGLDRNLIDFKTIKPLLFCRDLIRGGKPQFFLEIKTKVSYEELATNIKERTIYQKEYDDDYIKSIKIDEKFNYNNKDYSSELIAYLAIKLGEI